MDSGKAGRGFPISVESAREGPAVKPPRAGSVQLYELLKLAPQDSLPGEGPPTKEKLPGIKSRLRETGITEVRNTEHPDNQTKPIHVIKQEGLGF